mmetsp:Transcript_6173/g.8004  ORF Transcript_6173/g.8004 Transcript_6173/m.8004 type:complete len:650 (-) Transcript_6173:309-2258(-)|eukprot:CAMPEP_0198143740 /NCGR_PEP_ID=MMETSP1443-20131203/10275_1 /TAXON_ID=186043 /ORGANISM="Entomoneis sp., Strain CCMP2396" /LENGTH=649 /DNA_ID=CAMNT_0043807025 /DNA_START=31 /DNA_END=1980 /DNA_ORIENTATION=+
MCKRPETKIEPPAEEVSTQLKGEAIAPSHTAKERSTKYDWLLFLGPALFWKITPIAPMYITVIARMFFTHLILSLHYMFVDKENYLNKISEKQLKRERDDYLTGYYLHMWAQIPLQLLFPSMFFSDNSGIKQCIFEAFLAHIFVVEPLYYAAHRWLHVPTQMKAMHGFHHLSINTLPSTSLVQNFHEHFLYVATFGPAFFLPYLLFGRQHWVAVGGYLVAFDVINSFGHSNIRIRSWLFTSKYSPLTYLFYTPEVHLGHHAYFNKNFCLFMPLWDIMLGTYREYRKKDVQLLPKNQQDFVFIGHNGGLGHLLTIPELSVYNMYDNYVRTWLPLSTEILVMHVIASITRLLAPFYYCPRYCVANEYIGRIVCLSRSPYDYMKSSRYNDVNKDIVKLIKKEHQKKGTRKFGLGNLNKMKQLNDGGIEIAKMVKEDEYLKDKNIRVWTGDTLTVASVYHIIADMPELQSFYYIGAGGKVGTAVCEMLVKSKPNIKIKIFSRHQILDHPNISYSTDLSEMADYEVVLAGKILSNKMYKTALKNVSGDVRTRVLLDYTVPIMPIEAIQKHSADIKHIRVGLLKTQTNNAFLKGYWDICMAHPQYHIVPCHFGCLLHTVCERETNEVGDICQKEVDKLWRMALARGFSNAQIEVS